jgi:hypothetical protein
VRVSIVELRAWVRASAEMAERDSFPGLAKALRGYEDEMDQWMQDGLHVVEIVPTK